MKFNYPELNTNRTARESISSEELVKHFNELIQKSANALDEVQNVLMILAEKEVDTYWKQLTFLTSTNRISFQYIRPSPSLRYDPEDSEATTAIIWRVGRYVPSKSKFQDWLYTNIPAPKTCKYGVRSFCKAKSYVDPKILDLALYIEESLSTLRVCVSKNRLNRNAIKRLQKPINDLSHEIELVEVPVK